MSVKFVRQAVADALRFQALKAQGEIQASHMTIQAYAGHWMVRAYHPEASLEPDPPNGRIEKLDHYVTTPRYRNKTRMNRNAENRLASEKRELQRALRSVPLYDEDEEPIEPLF